VIRASDRFTFVADICDLQQNVMDLGKAYSLKNRVSQLKVAPEIYQHFLDTERVCLLKTMKAACSVAGFVLGTGLVVTGLAASPTWMLGAAALSLTGTLLAFGAGLYEEGMRFEKIKFFSEKHVQVLPSNPAICSVV
jgi:hypothetical protein